MPSVLIIGAGLAGSLLSIYLARRGFDVNVFEARGDMRRESMSAGRSINLALSDRGIAALREVGMDEYMLAEAVPMTGRMIHSPDGQTRLLPYSGRSGEYINSVSRAGLNIALMNEAEKYPNVQIVFNERCVDFDTKRGEAAFASGRTMRAGTVIATDGAGSAVRKAMMNGGVERFEFSQSWLDHGYKELHIPPGDSGSFLLEKNALHIWPRRRFMMIALPNFDGSFTCTLFLAHKSDSAEEPAFDQLTSEDAVREFFEREFADAVPLMPTLVEDFFANPTGNLGTIKCFPWSIGGRSLLIGDSAHAIVPFYGQGMNCSFEDVRVFDQLVEEHGDDWETVFDAYGTLRKGNTDAIADMAVENFYEMRDAVADPVFVRKRELETTLEQTYADYFSKYSMVTFREDLPYSVAKEKGNAQDALLMEICSKTEDVSSLDLADVRERLSQI
ncbi:MAG: NAD(P)/FAD-dependent oxidoreductase [Pyrinomonadaceae bacterium]|nr:NAD(P)/FAD-dependent oxidoreductase [Pyrinomonadaceae bacterium]